MVCGTDAVGTPTVPSVRELLRRLALSRDIFLCALLQTAMAHSPAFDDIGASTSIVDRARNVIGGPDPIFSLDGRAENPLKILTRHWMNERNSPDILVFQGALLERILENLHQQVKFCHRPMLARCLGCFAPTLHP